MEKLSAIFKKQGGLNLLKQYASSGSLFTALCQFLLLGKSRTALEILRLSAQFKGKRKLYKNYLPVLQEFDRTYDHTLPHDPGDTVWVCWFQGIDEAPDLVKRCYRSLQENLAPQKIVLITRENMEQYVQFPAYIIKKWNAGIITNTHMTDLLRLELLIRYGGLWVDATVLCTRPLAQIPNYYFDSDLFLYQCLKPGRDGHSHLCSSWLLSARTNNQLLMAVLCLCYAYWKKENKMIDYFLLHDFMSICLEYYPHIWQAIVPCCNSTAHILLLRLFDAYDEKLYESICAQTPFHKLSYKFTSEQASLPGTYYQYVIQ